MIMDSNVHYPNYNLIWTIINDNLQIIKMKFVKVNEFDQFDTGQFEPINLSLKDNIVPENP